MAVEGSVSPTERERDSNAKKRFIKEGEVGTGAEVLLSLEAGALKLERDLSATYGNNEIDARIPFRARVEEVVAFVVWFAVIASCAAQYPMVWVAFWNHVQKIQEGSNPLRHRSVALPLWGLWVVGLFFYRRSIYKRASPDLGGLLLHAEIFACVVLTMTVCVNFASFLHQPGPRLYDIGFLIIPEQGLHSPWRPVSDVLTSLLPCIAIVRSLFMDRKRRVSLITSWFRLVSIVYTFRCLSVTLTSLPGPAPHCQDKSLYNPPESWHEIATRMGVMVGDFSSCGDLLFSGHAAFTTTTMLVFVKSWRGHPTYKVWKVLGVVYLMTMCTLAIAGRKHYSVDITLGILIASLTFFRFENGWSASLNGGAASASATAIVKASYDPHTERKHAYMIA